EPAFDPLAMRQALEKRPRVQCKMYDARHGFCDADSATFDAALIFLKTQLVFLGMYIILCLREWLIYFFPRSWLFILVFPVLLLA
ncbi:hypothetical protein MJM28_29780, partial [Salmonella enterica subsp. enterica serovar Montevideo]|nr:hypothetical protein [Salmonella enterica subsp. enterica serovar Montevideo]